MNLIFLIHGVPKGNDIWGDDEGRSYVQNFYNGQTSSEQSKLFVEVLKQKNVSFYTYLRERNVISSEGRAGSYFGMTVGFQNEFCKDVENLYRLFDLVYEKMIKQEILASIEDKEKYLISRFSEKEILVQKIKTTLFSQIEKSFVNDMIPLDSSFIGDSNVVSKYYAEDVGNSSFLKKFKKNLKAKISYDYPSKDALIELTSRELKKSQSLCAQQNERISTLNSQVTSLSSLKGKIQEREIELNGCKLNLEKYQLENKKLQGELQTLQQQRKEYVVLKEQVITLKKEIATQKQTIVSLNGELQNKKKTDWRHITNGEKTSVAETSQITTKDAFKQKTIIYLKKILCSKDGLAMIGAAIMGIIVLLIIL